MGGTPQQTNVRKKTSSSDSESSPSQAPKPTKQVQSDGKQGNGGGGKGGQAAGALKEESSMELILQAVREIEKKVDGSIEENRSLENQ